MLRTLSMLCLFVAGCSQSVTSPDAAAGAAGTGSRNPVVRETLTGDIGASTSAACPAAFRAAVDASYFDTGTGRCVELRRRSSTAGILTARLTWQDVRIDLDLVLNDTVDLNYRQSIAANRCCETLEFFVNAGMDYSFIIYLRGVDAQFLANGGTFDGAVATRFTLDVERPE
jgi:hypothetical protein